MERKIGYIFLHCADSLLNLPADNIQQFFFAPCQVPDSKTGKLVWQYKGKYYATQAELPNESLFGMSIRRLPFEGRGWLRGGYHKIVEASGKCVTYYQDDSYTNGILPFNNIITNYNSLHISCVGGEHFVDTRTVAQKETVQKELLNWLKLYPEVKIGGHCQVNNVSSAGWKCPGFWVPDWLKEIGIPDKNILKMDPYGYEKMFKAA